MTDAPDNIVLELLREIRAQVGRSSTDMADAKVRLTAIEHNMAVINGRIDRIETRLDRIERRLELVDV